MDERYFFNPMLFGQLLAMKSGKEIFQYVCEGLSEVYGDDAPDNATVRAYLTREDFDPSLLTQEQKTIINLKLQEHLESDAQMLRDLLLYKHMKACGEVKDFDEYLQLRYPDEEL